MSEWKEVELVDCTVKGNISYGIVQPGQDEPNGVPILRVNNFENGILNTDSILKVNSRIESKHSKTRLKGGEVLLTLVGSTGQTAIVPEKLKGWNVARAVAVIDVKPEIGAKWINLWLRSNQARHYLDSRANTTVQKTLNLKDVKSIPVSIPPENERKSIENIIYSLEEKIELNRQMNQTLEAMAQALFKSWFVDFDPVLDNLPAEEAGALPDALKAKYERRKAIPDDKKLLRTNPSLAAQFPASFVFNETLGKWIPEGWEVKSLENICEQVIRGFTTNYVEKSNLINLNQKVNKGDILEKQHFKYYPEDTIVPKDKFARKHDILMNSLGQGTLGRVHYYKEDSKNVVVDQHITIIRASIGSAYIYHFLKSKEGYEGLMARITGSTGMLMLNVNVIRTFEIPLPNQNLLGQFQRKVEGLYSKINNNDFESETLVQLRDRLLQELISGRVRVPDNLLIKISKPN